MKYFDVDVAMIGYEHTNGEPLRDDLVKLVRIFEPIINAAYERGYADAMKAEREGVAV